MELLYDNEYGGFSNDGKEYKIKIKKNERTPMPWSHIMANDKFGTLITTNGGGYTWHGNSRENKLTAWSNDMIGDVASEIIYIKTKEGVYTATPIAIGDREYAITYGFGYAVYETEYEEIKQKLTTFIPKDGCEKINVLKLKNNSEELKEIKLYYYINPVLGVSREYTKKHIFSKKNGNRIELYNKYRENYDEFVTYISTNEAINSYTTEKENFDIKLGIQKEVIGVCKDVCAVIEVQFNLESNEERTIYFSLGEQDENSFQNIEEKLKETKEYWSKLLNTVQVKTPVESMNIMLNGWLVYQTIVSRLFARTGFYQAGGAYGFRDQLQDLIGILMINPALARKQIVYHAAHQFIEGDVLHWWHPEKDNGIRTRYKDDLLWLPYVVYEYIKVTGDEEILNEEISYIEGKKLLDEEDESYQENVKSHISENLYMHCKRAIDVSLNYGQNGLPKMGSGDWNDGMNKVSGESVWLGFFLYNVLEKFSKICRIKNEENLIIKYEKEMEKLKYALNSNAWDGKWYKRAFFEDGTPLGSNQNDECKIDSISQSWSVISKAGEDEKSRMAMESLNAYLVDRENMVIKLLTPPFENINKEVGYIKAYIPGVRENGGQYTHGAIWAIIANSLLKNGNRAEEYFRIINPIEHARTKENALKYKVEPYVVAADVYGAGKLIGRGGWTWYTGSSSWLYTAGLNYVLGLRKERDKLRIVPAIPEEWSKYEIEYVYENTLYKIIVKNPNHKQSGVKNIYLDNNLLMSHEIELVDDERVHTIEVEM